MNWRDVISFSSDLGGVCDIVDVMLFEDESLTPFPNNTYGEQYWSSTPEYF
jgi:hypothetical protein